MQHLPWTPDILPGFEQTGLCGLRDAHGPMDVVLVRRRCTREPAAASAQALGVLYIHGYVDYFFQSHLADFYNQLGLHFYAVELRRHGRALRSGQRPNYTADLDEYLQDVDAAITCLREDEGIDWMLLSGHSTGGLVAALYAHRGRQRTAVDALFLNSPFLDMNLPQWQQTYLEPLLAALGGVFTGMRLPGLSKFYGQSLHASCAGSWNYNTAWKPLQGFAVYAGWFRAIHRAHAEVAKGLRIDCPCLLMHAQRSTRPDVWNEDVMRTDIVLNVADMVRLAPRLGRDVAVVAIEDGIHDLVLSRPAPRAQVFSQLAQWLGRIVPSRRAPGAAS